MNYSKQVVRRWHLMKKNNQQTIRNSQLAKIKKSENLGSERNLTPFFAY